MKVEAVRKGQAFEPILLKLTIESEEERVAFTAALKRGWRDSDAINRTMLDEIINVLLSYS